MNVALTLSETECQTLAGLLDLACKAGGLRVAKDVSHLADKLDQAMQAANKRANAEDAEAAVAADWNPKPSRALDGTIQDY